MNGSESGIILGMIQRNQTNLYELCIKSLFMKQQVVFRLLGISIICLFIFSCSKNTQPQTKTQLLVSASWKLKSATVNGSDAMHLVQDCQKDNIISFSANGTGIITEGATKCNAGDPDTVPFTWSFQSNETILNISAELISYGSNDMTLVKLNTTTLVVNINYTPPVGPSRFIELTFEH